MDVRTAFFGLLLAILGYIGVLMVFPLLPYVIAAALLAFVLYPSQRRLEARLESTHLEGWLGTKLVALGLTGFALVGAIVPIAIFSVILFRTVVGFLTNVDGPTAFDQFESFLIDVGIDPTYIGDLEAELGEEFQEELLTDGIDLLTGELLRLVNTSIEMGLGLLVLVFLLYYLLVDGDRFVAWLGAIAPLEDHVRVRLFDEVNVVTWAVIKSHVLVALVEGVLAGIGLWVVGIPNVAFWTMVMVVVAFLPAIGVWLVWGPAVGYLFLIGEPLLGGLLLVYGITVLSVVDNYLRAVFVDMGSGLHPAVVLVGVIGGIYLFGIMGLFIGPVILGVFKAALNVFGEAHGSLEATSTQAGGTADTNAPGSSDATPTGLESRPDPDPDLEPDSN